MPYSLIIILGFIGFVTSFGAHIVAVNLPSYAEQVGVGLAMIGLLIASYDIAEIVAKPVFGTLADKKGMKPTIMWGIGLFVLASLAYPWIDPKFLLIIRFLQGIGAAALSAVSLALVGVYAKEKQRGRAYGIYNAIKGAGYVISPVIGGAIVWQSDFSSIFYAAAFVGSVAFLLSLLLPKSEKEPTDIFDDDDFSLRSTLKLFRDPHLSPWYLVTVVNMFFVGILFGFLPVQINVLGYEPHISGIFLSLVTASYLLIQPIVGFLADRMKPGITIKVGLALAGFCIIITPFVRGWILVLVAIIAGVGVGTVWTNTDALISQIARKSKLGATMGAAGTFKEFGDMIGPLLIGVVSQSFGLEIGFVACGILGMITVFLITRIRVIGSKELR